MRHGRMRSLNMRLCSFIFETGSFGTPRTPDAGLLEKKVSLSLFLTWPWRPASAASSCQIAPPCSRRRYGVDVMHREATADARQR